MRLKLMFRLLTASLDEKKISELLQLDEKTLRRNRGAASAEQPPLPPQALLLKSKTRGGGGKDLSPRGLSRK